MRFFILCIVAILPFALAQGGQGGAGGFGGGAPGMPGGSGGSDLSAYFASIATNDDWINLLLRQYLAEESKLSEKRKNGFVGSVYVPSEIYPFYFPMYFPIRYGAGGVGGSGGGYSGGLGGAPGMPGQPGYRK